MGWQVVFQTDLKKARRWAVRGLWGNGGDGGEGDGVVLWSVEGLLVVEVEIQDFSVGWWFGGVVALPCSSSGFGSLCCV